MLLQSTSTKLIWNPSHSWWVLASDVDRVHCHAAVVTLEGGYRHLHRPLWPKVVDDNMCGDIFGLFLSAPRFVVP